MPESLNASYLALRRKIMEKEFARMNPMQKQAVFSVDGPLLILAGAGSGKTTVLVNRIANMIKFGNAWYSTTVPEWLSETDISLMEDYCSGRNPDFESIKGLLSVRPAKAWQILAITFTNKAAGELKDRLEKMLGPEADEIWASTFHSSCARILRRDADKIGYTRSFTVYDTDDSRRLMKECQRMLGIDDKTLNHKAILSAIGKAKDQLLSPAAYEKEAGFDFRLKKIAEAYALYQKMLKSADAMDFDDLLYNTVRLLQQEKDVLEYYQNRFKYILVDEYQDTNHVQYVFTGLLAAKSRNLCVVGDDDQSIYRFRGATIENILGFEKQYPEAKVIRLEQNYRSTQNILDAANAVIGNNKTRKGKELWTKNDRGDKVFLYTAPDEREEARYIGEQILEGVKNGRNWSDHAILYRLNAQSNALENVFIRMAIPYKIIGGFRFYERKEIKDAISYLSIINNPSDTIRLRRIINEPKRGIGDASITHALEIAAGLGIPLFEVLKTANQYDVLSRSASRMTAFAAMIEQLAELAEQISLHELFEQMLDKTGYMAALRLEGEAAEDRIENLNELSSNLIAFENEHEAPDLSGFLEEVALITDIDSYDKSADRVPMMTMHAAKGLEFPVVFLPGMEEGIFPGRQSMYYPEELEEERRLAYVGVTRAMEKITLLNADTRMLYGSTTHNRRSRFVEEIPEELTESKSSRPSPPPAAYAKQERPERHSYLKEHSVRPPQNQISGLSFARGDSVSHRVFGNGVVLNVTPMGNDVLLEIAFAQAGTKKVMANFAKLQKL